VGINKSGTGGECPLQMLLRLNQASGFAQQGSQQKTGVCVCRINR